VAGVQQVAFFCNSPTLAVDGIKRIQHFADLGHIIANHTAHHPNLNQMTPDDFIKDIAQADQELRGFPGFRKWFRFPYLREGATQKDINSVRKYLDSTGYRNGYVTVNIEDWYANEILLQAIANGKKWDHVNLCQTYTRIITDEAEFYDDMSVKALNRSVKHVALLHETDINALCIVEIVDGLRAQGWKIISPDLAYTDPIAKNEPPSTVPLHMGRVFALAKQVGYKGPYWSKWINELEIDSEFERKKVFYK
jgi:peptidoglycan-N-acetylglucosamine deacetylase